jgi:chromosome segregation ATPase
MEKRITLQDIIDHIDQRFDHMDQRFDSLEKRVGFLEHQSGILQRDVRTLDYKIDDNARETHLIRQKTDRIELMTFTLQKDIEGLSDEMKGVHKVLDQFDGRITRLEIHTGIPIESVEG